MENPKSLHERAAEAQDTVADLTVRVADLERTIALLRIEANDREAVTTTAQAANRRLQSEINGLSVLNRKLTEEVVEWQNKDRRRESAEALARVGHGDGYYFTTKADGLTDALVLANDEVVHWKRVAKDAGAARDHHYQSVVDKNERIRDLKVQLDKAARELEDAQESARAWAKDHNKVANELREVRQHDEETTQALITERNKREDSVPRALVNRWATGLARQAVEAEKLGQWHIVGINRAISVALWNILNGKELPDTK